MSLIWLFMEVALRLAIANDAIGRYGVDHALAEELHRVAERQLERIEAAWEKEGGNLFPIWIEAKRKTYLWWQMRWALNPNPWGIEEPIVAYSKVKILLGGGKMPSPYLGD